MKRRADRQRQENGGGDCKKGPLSRGEQTEGQARPTHAASGESGGLVMFWPLRPEQGTKETDLGAKLAVARKPVIFVLISLKRSSDQLHMSILFTATISR